jgi:EpsI family protein
MKKYLSVIIIILAAGLIGNTLRYNQKMPAQTADFSVIPLHYAGYYGVEQKLQDFAADVLRADITTVRDYFKDDRRLQLFLAYFRSQKYGRQIHSPKHCLPGGGWRIDEIETFPLTFPDGTTKNINRLHISVKNYQAVMLYWFETRSGLIRNEYGLKLDLVKNAFLFRPTDAAIVRVTIDASDGNFDLARQKAIDFIHDFYPHIIAALPFVE